MASPQVRKEAILKKLLPPINKSVAEAVAKEEGIPATTTIYSWRVKANHSGATGVFQGGC